MSSEIQPIVAQAQGVVEHGRYGLLCAVEIATPEEFDSLVKECCRWPVGPFEMTGQQTRQEWK